MADPMELIDLMPAENFRNFLYWMVGSVLFDRLPKPLARACTYRLCRVKEGTSDSGVESPVVKDLVTKLCIVDEKLGDCFTKSLEAMRVPRTPQRFAVCATLKNVCDDFKGDMCRFMESYTPPGEDDNNASYVED